MLRARCPTRVSGRGEPVTRWGVHPGAPENRLTHRKRGVAMATVVGAAAGVAGTKLLQKLVSDLYDGASGKVKRTVAKWKSTRKIKSLYTKIANVRNVKTIWQIDKEVDLLDFYHPTKIAFDGKRVEIGDVSRFPYDGNLIVQGAVGQGKSIFLRFLCSQELLKGERIPLFLELRRVRKGQGLVRHLIRSLEVLGFNGVDRTVLEFLASTGRLCLFLDAFDEISEELREAIVTEIETLAAKHDALRIVISSRPGSGVDRSTFLRVFNLADIQPDEIEAVVYRLMGDRKTAKRLLTQLEQNPSEIKGVLTTPLLITLLVITFKGYDTIPARMSEFYERLFPTLISRHDQTKPGYYRRRKSGLNDQRIQEVFDAFCFATKRLQKGTFSQREVFETCRKAIAKTQNTCDEGDFLQDIMKITCLLLEEGGDYHFLHKSIQEYHAACFIRSLPEDSGMRFYRQMLEADWMAWAAELEVLSEIDRYRYLKHLRIPEIENAFTMVFDAAPKGNPRITRGGLERFCAAVNLRITVHGAYFGAGFSHTRFAQRMGFTPPSCSVHMPLVTESGCDKGLRAWRKKEERLREAITRSSDVARSDKWVPVAVLMSGGVLDVGDFKGFDRVAREWFKEWDAARKYVAMEDQKLSLADL